jgi:predicted metalloprotease with PDZ domain
MISYPHTRANPERHLFAVEIELDTAGASSIDVEFPAWSPGRYFIYDFARNVQGFAARSGRTELPLEKVAKGTWRVSTGGHERIRIRYLMFGDTLSGTFSQLDDRHASINGSSVFAYVVGREREPIELEVIAPEGWKTYTSLKRRRSAGRTVLHAENYDVLIDSPMEIGTPIARRFALDGVTYHVVIDMAAAESWRRSAAVRERIGRVGADVEKTVRMQTATFGRPEFDEYHFLVNIDPSASGGDGMEHLTSTRLVLAGHPTKQENYDALIGVASHEFFHIWNVMRLRPAVLGPFDYTRERHTTLLWFAEGFTQYYGHLMLRRAGVWDEKQLYKELADELNSVDQSPGRFHRNLRESSYDTWQITSARNPLGPTSNFKNTYVNYYPKGAVVAFMLDLEIRRLTSDRRSLDDVMRALYRSHYEEREVGEYFLRGSGYSEADIYAGVEQVAGRAARNFLKRLVEERDEIDYARHLRHVGLEITRAPKSAAGRRDREAPAEQRPQLYLGVIVADAKARATSEFVAVANVIEGSPAERAGISAGDLIVAVDGERTDGRRWDAVMEMKRPGERIEVALFRGARLLTKEVTAAALDRRPMRIEPLKNATDKQRRAREKWLAGNAGRTGS